MAVLLFPYSNPLLSWRTALEETNLCRTSVCRPRSCPHHFIRAITLPLNWYLGTLQCEFGC